MPGHDPAPGAHGAPRRLERAPLRELWPLPRLAGLGLIPSPASTPDVILYTDGACTGNPGPGGWAALVIEGVEERTLSGAELGTTNQRMELRAALEGLRAIPGRRRVRLHSDSAYVVNCFRESWWRRWERNGWTNAQRQLVANRDLWQQLLAEAERHDVIWLKVRGHAGDPLNECVDRLARAAAATARTR